MIAFLLDHAKEAALLLFFGMFLVILYTLVRPGSSAAFRDAAKIPLEDKDV
jgi:cbb3-type cytochrome oxidase subunit 3